MRSALSGTSRVFVAGHTGMVGSAVVRKLEEFGVGEVVTAPRSELDLLEQDSVHRFLSERRPDWIVLAAAKVGGILANNSRRGDFIYQNLVIQNNVIHGAHLAGIDNLLFLGSSCIYPRDCPQPIREEYLLTGSLEPTNEPYAIAKIAGVKLCEAYHSQYGRNYFSIMPTNLYGPNDNYDPLGSHVLPALIRRAHEAKVSGANTIEIWGSGEPKREFLYVDDLADACIFLMRRGYCGPLVNVGSGSDLSIRELATLVCSVVGVPAKLSFDRSKPDGTPRKLLDVTRMTRMGWRAKTGLMEGLQQTYADFLESCGGRRLV